jgi:hypothetical protein
MECVILHRPNYDFLNQFIRSQKPIDGNFGKTFSQTGMLKET